MPDERLITEIENLLANVVALGGSNERSQIVPNLTVINANPVGLDGFVIVSDNRDGDNIVAKKVGSVIYSDNDLVNIMFLEGTEAIAFQQGSESGSTGDIWEIVPGTSTDIFYDRGNVGIGKDVAPDAALEILDNSQDQLRLTNVEDTSFAKFNLDSNSNLTITPSSTGQVILQPTLDSTDFFQVLDADGGAPVINADSLNERFGVGTATIPEGGTGMAKFAIDGANASTSGPHIQITTDAEDFPRLQVRAWSEDDVRIFFDSYSDAISSFKSSDLGSNFSIEKTANKLAMLYSSGNAKGAAVSFNDGIILDNSGQVGIGEFDPADKVTVKGLTGVDVNVGLYTNDGDGTDNANFSIYGVGTPGSSTNRERLLIQYDSSQLFRIQSEANGTGVVRDLVIETDGNANQLYLDADGNVGVRTNTPDARVDILDTGGAQLRLTHTDNTVFVDFTLDSGDDLTITPSSTGRIILQPTTDSTTFFQVLDADGGTAVLNVNSTNERVGVGTSSPNTRFESQSDNQTQLRLTHTDSSKFTDFTVDTNHDLTIQPSSTGQVIFQPTTDSTDFFQVLDADGGTPILNVDSTNERIGVGDSGPDSKLVVNGQEFIGTAAASGNTSNGDMTIGLTVNLAGNDDSAISLKDSVDVDHGMTSIRETDTFYSIRKAENADGGAAINGFSSDTRGLTFGGNATNGITTSTTAALGAIELRGTLKSGTGIGDMAANDNVVIIRNNATTRFILKGDGDYLFGGSDIGPITDEYDDPELLAGYRALLSPEDSPARKRFTGFLKDTEDILVQQGVLTAPLAEGGLVRNSGLNGLLIDAIYQLNGKIKRLETQHGIN